MFTASEQKVNSLVCHQSHDRMDGLGHNQRMAKTDINAPKTGPGDFGVNLKAKRTGMGMTMDALADRARVSKGYISSLETGARTNPSEAMARKLAEVFICPVSELWGNSQSAFETRALELLRSMPEDRREAAIASLYGLAAGLK
jgi:transcriptional regulator with XRE-family HTH domain